MTMLMTGMMIMTTGTTIFMTPMAGGMMTTTRGDQTMRMTTTRGDQTMMMTTTRGDMTTIIPRRLISLKTIAGKWAGLALRSYAPPSGQAQLSVCFVLS